MSHENSKKFLFYTCFWVFSCTHPACSQGLNTLKTPEIPPMISHLEQYRLSISHAEYKRMVSLKNYLTPFFSDIKYASSQNFTHQILYVHPVVLVRRQVADSLLKVQQDLAAQGLSLKFFDAYRPWSVTKKMWDVVPDERYAANPSHGSGHNRGIAVDVTLANISTGEELLMPTEFDNFTEKAHHDYMPLSKQVIDNRNLLKYVMQQHGFVALPTEWWHYSLKSTTGNFEILNLDFADLKHFAGKASDK